VHQGINIAGVQFRRAGKIYDFKYEELPLNVGDHVVVDTERGPSLARVVMLKFEAESDNSKRELKDILRRAGHKELEKKSKLTTDEIVSFTKDKVNTLKLDMTVLTSEVQFGGGKITIFFTSPGRVDFRELVKELASGLKSRVELKQVGARDEAKLIGGTGICGREFCCSSFLREFVPVSIKMAKNQNLALNPNKVSGGCGRLLCCLTYEDDTYSSLKKKFPKKGTKVYVAEIGGYCTIIKNDLLNEEVVVENERGQVETYALEDIEVLNKKEGRVEEKTSDWGDDLDLDALEKFANQSKKQNKNFKNKNNDRSNESNSKRSDNRNDESSNQESLDTRKPKQEKNRNRYNKRHKNKNTQQKSGKSYNSKQKSAKQKKKPEGNKSGD